VKTKAVIINPLTEPPKNELHFGGFELANEHGSEQVRTQIDIIYRTESRRIFATLIRLLGDFDLAEDALHEAFRVAMEQWPRDGVPANPRAWLVSTGRFKAIDALRRRARFDASLVVLAEQLDRWEAPSDAFLVTYDADLGDSVPSLDFESLDLP